MDAFKGWEDIGDGECIAVFPELGHITVSKDRVSGEWQVSALSWSRGSIASVAEAKAQGIAMARERLEAALVMLDTLERG